MGAEVVALPTAFPVPRLDRADPRWVRVVGLAGRLAAIDDRYGDWAAAVSVDCGAMDRADRAAAIAELDAVVAHAYGLERAELELSFEDFPATDAGISPARRAAIVEHHARWVS